MLTIQPRFTQQASRTVQFRGNEEYLNEETYNQKKSYYQRQKEGFEEILNDENVPAEMKKGAKVFKIASEGILEGWAVTWAATKGGNILKSSFIKAANSKFAKWAAEMLSPVGKGLKTSAQKLMESLSNKTTNIKQSKFVNKLLENLNKTKAGQFVLNAAKTVGKGLKTALTFVKNLGQKIISPLKDLTYDKAAKATARTLGVGSGLAGAYSAARTPNDDQILDEFEQA